MTIARASPHGAAGATRRPTPSRDTRDTRDSDSSCFSDLVKREATKDKEHHFTNNLKEMFTKEEMELKVVQLRQQSRAAQRAIKDMEQKLELGVWRGTDMLGDGFGAVTAAFGTSWFWSYQLTFRQTYNDKNAQYFIAVRLTQLSPTHTLLPHNDAHQSALHSTSLHSSLPSIYPPTYLSTYLPTYPHWLAHSKPPTDPPTLRPAHAHTNPPTHRLTDLPTDFSSTHQPFSIQLFHSSCSYLQTSS